MITCRRAAELAARSLDAPLPWPQRAALWLHLRGCAACRRFRRHAAAVAAAAADLFRAAPSGPALPAAAKDRLRNLIRERLDRGA